MYHPHDYQAQCLAVIKKARDAGNLAALIVMASGLGKTVVAGLDARRFLRANPAARVLYLCHQTDILEQAKEEFEQHILPQHCTYGFFHGGEKDIHGVTVLFASFQTMHKHREKFKPDEFDYIVVDESHHSPATTYLPTLQYFQPQFTLAITATPDRMDLQDIRSIYGDEVYNMPLEVALREGLLTPVDYRVMTDELHYQRVLETPVGKLSIKQLNKLIFLKKRDDEIVRIIAEKVSDVRKPRMVIFCPRTAYCDQLAAKIPGALPVHSRLSVREQRERLKAFREGKLNTILTVDKFNEGIDVPEANVIVFLRSTASQTVYFQQLGRGLRVKKDKKQVLVLDFVASWERLAMIQALWRATQKAGLSGPSEKPLVIQGGHFDFTEVAQDVLQLIERIKGGYTQEMLVEQLQKLAKELGRTPMQIDVGLASTQGKCASTAVFGRMFGSFTAALKAAGMRPNISPFTEEELLTQLKTLAGKLGRTPMSKDIGDACKRNECVSVGVYARVFGSLNRAITLARLPLTVKRGYTKQELINEMKLFAEQLGRTPGTADYKLLAKGRGFASHRTLSVQFGSFNKALIAAGLKPNQTKNESKDSLVMRIREMAATLGRPPTWKDIEQYSKTRNWPSVHVYRRRFGGITELHKAAGLQTKKYTFTDKELVEHLQKLSYELGRTPRQSEVDSACVKGITPGTTVYKNRFGSLEKAWEAAGLTYNKRRQPPKDQLIRLLQEFAQELGRIPSMEDINNASRENRTPGQGTFQSAFGSWSAALRAAGLR